MCTELNCCFKDDILAQVKTSATNPRVSPYIQGIIYIIRHPGDVKITSDETGRNTIKYHVKLKKDNKMKTNYYGVYVSPYLYDGEPYIGSPKYTLEECYSACGTDEECLRVFDNEHDAEEYRDIVSQM